MRVTSVHPRVCGEQIFARVRVVTSSGSSPRVRGTVFAYGTVALTVRFIPACAGNSAPADRPVVWNSVHPRVCRGTGSRNQAERIHRRFIPACAGNSRLQVAVLAVEPVHPRVCGEQCGPYRPPAWLTGSSPRVRGTASHPGFCRRLSRFIPASAGNSRTGSPLALQISVHPRVCGEQPFKPRLSRLSFGSSPRVRGTALIMSRRVTTPRFIPACAGNRGPWIWSDPLAAVHPRVCGGTASQLDFVQKTLVFRSKKFRLWRFTPKPAQWAKGSLRSSQHLAIALGRMTILSYFFI